MKRFSTSFLSIGLLLSLAASSAVFADSCCNTSCSTSGSSSCATSCSTNTNCNTNCNDCTTCSSVLIAKPSHENVALFYGNPYEHLDTDCDWNFGTFVAYEFQQTFNDCNLGNCLFGSNSLTFQGSHVAGRSSTALLADNFGLSQDFNGSVTFNPQIRSQNLHWGGWLGFDRWVSGLYLRADLTFSHQQRTLCSNDCNSGCGDCGDNNCNSCNTGCNTGCSTTNSTSTSSTMTTGGFCATTLASTSLDTAFPVGYMGNAAVTPATSIQQALSGTFLFGDMQTPWNYGRFNSCQMSTNKLSGFSFDFGYDFWRCEDSHFGIFLRYSAPTGSKLDGSQDNSANVFAPIVGNGHHNELGGGLSAWKEFWSNDCNSLSIYLDGYATHLFEDCQIRTFDFLDKGCLSRYMLLKQLRPLTTAETALALPTSATYFTGVAGSPVAGVSSGANADSAFAYNGVLVSGVNFSTRNVESSFDVQGDAALRLVWEHRKFRGSIGYEIFGRSHEKVCIKAGPVCNGFDPSLQYAFKGCQGAYYYAYNTPIGAATILNPPAATVIASNATASNATITTCGTIDNAVSVSVPSVGGTAGFVGVAYTNAYSGTGGTSGGAVIPVAANAVANGTLVSAVSLAQVSEGAVVIPQDSSALNLDSGRASRLISNKGFITLEYVWDECNWSPFLEIGGEVEGGSCNCDVKQWGVWVKLGFSI
jgi:hypothetical protein